MAIFLRFSVIYFTFGALFVALFRESPGAVIGEMMATVPSAMTFFLSQGWWALAGFGALFFLLPRDVLFARIPRAIATLGACSLFFLTFTIVKMTLPFAVPFWADPMLAGLDRALHFGADPWTITHAVLPVWGGDIWQSYYIGLWMIPAMYFPVLLLLFDDDEARIRRYIKMYIFAWAGLGTFAALVFMSGGPVFYHALTGDAEFAPMHDALRVAGILDSEVGATQAALWAAWTSGSQSLGSGISAFPSVHVAVASVIGLYIAERVRFARWPMVAMVAGYQILSVHLGWHYAIDGYFSIVTVLALAAWLVRRPAVSRRALTAASS